MSDKSQSIPGSQAWRASVSRQRRVFIYSGHPVTDMRGKTHRLEVAGSRMAPVNLSGGDCWGEQVCYYQWHDVNAR